MAHVIKIPRKISRPRIKPTFQPEPTYSDIDEGHFICPDLGHTVLRSKNWEPGKRENIITFSSDSDQKVLDKLTFEETIRPPVKDLIVSIV